MSLRGVLPQKDDVAISSAHFKLTKRLPRPDFIGSRNDNWKCLEFIMRYIIYGAGGIGSTMGSYLARAGRSAVLVGRRGHVGAVTAGGLRLVTPAGDYVVRLPAVTAPADIKFGAEDVVCLCVKGQDTETALRDLKDAVDEIPVFCFQNGVRNEEIAAGFFPRVYGVMVRVGAQYLEDGTVTVRRDPPGWYLVGRYPAGTDALAEAVAGDLRAAGYLVRTTGDVMPYKWGKLMANLGNAIDGITGCDWGTTRSIYRAVFEEARAIVAKAGIRWISQERLAQEWPETRQPPRAEFDTIQRSSTWQSLARRQGSVETEFLNGEIVRLARRLGLTAPLNEKLVEITARMAANHEQPGKYPPEQLSEILKFKS
jgi:2-dehydropantoate 2-reductase